MDPAERSSPVDKANSTLTTKNFKKGHKRTTSSHEESADAKKLKTESTLADTTANTSSTVDNATQVIGGKGIRQTLKPTGLLEADRQFSSAIPLNADRVYSSPNTDPTIETEVSPRSQPTTKTGTKPKAAHNAVHHTALDSSKAPLSDINDIFADIAKKAIASGFSDICTKFQDQSLRVVTMCSGTESPILGLRLLQAALVRDNKAAFKFYHAASAEIEPFKQAFIQRNFEPPVIFRDVVEFAELPLHEDPRTVYNRPQPRPQNIHILIAGSSCVDYSSLNKSPKEFGEEGQSYSTMAGIRAYANQCRPNIVILENVKNAPWNKIEDFWTKIGYQTQVVQVDTKNYYIPQTRQRGYLLAFDCIRAKTVGFDVVTGSKKWVEMMTEFQQRASAPFTDFIFADDDPYLEQLRCGSRTFRDDGSKSGANDWAACRHRYSGFRLIKNLGSSRPLTNWVNNGSCQFPDFGHQKWAVKQPERIWDTLDINYLAYVAERDYDMNYKHRLIELSQNVDRDCDTRAWGLVGCMTPTGMPYLTSRGGPVTGREVLALQGLPLVQLSLTRETSRQLQDLAGNAMTTTVATAAMLSALIAVKDAPFLGDYLTELSENGLSTDHEAVSLEDLLHHFAGKMNLVEDTVDVGSIADHTFESLLDQAFQTLQLCKCEGFASMKESDFWLCNKCGHSACTICAGNPQHSYRTVSGIRLEKPLEKPLGPSEFIESISKSLPMSLRLKGLKPHGTSPQLRDVDSEKELTLYQKARSKVVPETMVLFQGVKRGKSWRVLYEGDHARLELRIHRNLNEAYCEWLLFAKPDVKAPRNCDSRRRLREPVARMFPTETLLGGSWEMQDQESTTVRLVISGIGPTVPSWERSLGLQGKTFSDQKRSTKLAISLEETDAKQLDAIKRRICGDYELLPRCGTAGGSLHRRITSEVTGKSMFLFLDPEPLQDGRFDRCVFATDPDRIADGDYRHVVAHLEDGWRPVELKVKQPVECTFKSAWSLYKDAALQPAHPDRALTIWKPKKLVSIADHYTHCQTTEKIVLLAKIPLTDSQRLEWKRGNQHRLRLSDGANALQGFKWLLQRACAIEGLDAWHEIHVSNLPSSQCLSCAPKLPKFEWRLSRPRSTARGKAPNKNARPASVKTQTASDADISTGEGAKDHNVAGNAKAPRSNSKNIKPFENREDAMAYESALRKRPLPVAAVTHSHTDHLVLEVKLNVVTLAHRCLARLDTVAHGEGLQVSADWRLVKGGQASRSPQFPIPLTTSNKEDPPWVKDDTTDPADEEFHTPFPERQLFPHQRRALTWMLQREDISPPEWHEQEVEETEVPSLDWRLEVKVSRSKKVFGGILADEVGAGKTTTCLALVQTTIQPQKPESHLEGVCDQGVIKSSATLILVPTNLLSQWESEIKACFVGLPLELIVVPNTKRLIDKSIEKIKSANIILAPWDLFDRDDYCQEMEHICNAPNVPLNAGRAFQQWLSEALFDLANLVRLSGGCNSAQRFWDAHATKQNQKQKYRAYETVSRRAEHMNKEATEAADSNSAVDSNLAVDSDLDYDSDTAVESDSTFVGEKPTRSKPPRLTPVLHFFKFKRLIVDEFTYLKGKSLLSVLQLVASSKWMLSGTPPLADFDSINTMAKLIGTKITTKDERDGCFSFLKDGAKLARDKTYAEEFTQYETECSAAWLEARNDKAAEFVSLFLRQNPADLTKVKMYEHYHLPRMSTMESALYFEVYQAIMSKSVKFGDKQNRTKKMVSATRAQRLKYTITRSGSREEALMACCSDMRVQYKEEGGKVISYVPGKLPTSAEGLCQQILDIEAESYSSTYAVLDTALRETYGYKNREPAESDEKNPHFSMFTTLISRGQLGDKTATDTIKEMLLTAKERPINPTTLLASSRRTASRIGLDEEDDEDEDEDDVPDAPGLNGEQKEAGKRAGATPNQRREEMRLRAIDLLVLADEMVNHNRYLRLFETFKEVVMYESLKSCSHCSEHIGEDLKDVLIMGICGHVVHRKCLNDQVRLNSNPDECPSQGCKAAALSHHLLKASSFSKRATSQPSVEGSKMSAVVDLIKRIPEDERIIVFIQFDRIKAHLLDCLEKAEKAGQIKTNAPPVVAPGEAKSGTRGHSQRQRKKTAPKKGLQSYIVNATSYTQREMKKFSEIGATSRICVLQIDSCDAAGWNLHIANHVIFVTPFLTGAAFEYQSVMTQAIGRALRFHQTEDVHVHHFLLCQTIEVNIMEERKQKKIVERAGSAEAESGEKGKYMKQAVDFGDSGRLVDAVEDGDETFEGPALDKKMDWGSDGEEEDGEEEES